MRDTYIDLDLELDLDIGHKVGSERMGRFWRGKIAEGFPEGQLQRGGELQDIFRKQGDLE